MTTRSNGSFDLSPAVLSGTLAALASVAFLLGRYPRVFEACRVLYRSHQPVQDSLACQAYSALGFFTVLALLAALASAGVALVRWNHNGAEFKNGK
jgi:hypothetical protein